MILGIDKPASIPQSYWDTLSDAQKQQIANAAGSTANLKTYVQQTQAQAVAGALPWILLAGAVGYVVFVKIRKGKGRKRSRRGRR